MAGHSKWHNIRHKKAAEDAKRGKIFTKIIRELVVAARDGGGVIEDNPTLRAVVDKAKAAEMPKDTIERAIARGAGGQEGGNYESLTYEGYGPGGVAIYVETTTDNKNRTVGDIRHAFSKAGGNLGTDGSVAFLFDRKGRISFDPGADEEQIVEVASEAGADDVDTDEDGAIEIFTTPQDLQTVKDALVEKGLEPVSAEVAMIPMTYSDLDVATGEKVLRLLDALDDLDDVQNVYTNANFPDELMREAS